MSKRHHYKRKLMFIAVVLVLSFVSVEGFCFQAEVVRVKDGDTVVVWNGSKLITVRIAGIDAPEKNQSHGLEAKKFLAEAIEGQVVEVKASKTDKYGRTIANLESFQGNDINLLMVREGYAWHYKKYSDSEELSEAERLARERGIGLWEDEDPQEPWNFRKSSKSRYIVSSTCGSSSVWWRAGAGSSSKKSLDMSRPVHVTGHWRNTKSGPVWIRPHTRSLPGTKTRNR